MFIFKEDIDHISYWVCDFQQYNIDRLQEIKPIKPIKNIKGITPDIILSRLTDLTFKFVNNNINYYLIEININNNKYTKLKNDIKILRNGKYVYIRRTMYNNEPCTEYNEINNKINIIIILLIIIIIILLYSFYYLFH